MVKKGRYELNAKGCRMFFTGKASIPRAIYKNPLTKEVIADEQLITIKDIPAISDLLDTNQEYMARYKDTDNKVQASFLD